MASPQITVRLDPEMYKAVLKLAQIEKKTLAEFTRELIEQGLGKHQSIETEVLDRLNIISAELGELLARSVKASAVAAYYAKLSTETTDESAHYITTNPKLQGGQVLDKETKKQRAQDRQKRSREIANHFLTAPLDQI
jgi:hypothetical protein